MMFVKSLFLMITPTSGSLQRVQARRLFVQYDACEAEYSKVLYTEPC